MDIVHDGKYEIPRIQDTATPELPDNRYFCATIGLPRHSHIASCILFAQLEESLVVFTQRTVSYSLGFKHPHRKDTVKFSHKQTNNKTVPFLCLFIFNSKMCLRWCLWFLPLLHLSPKQHSIWETNGHSYCKCTHCFQSFQLLPIKFLLTQTAI